jgi:hypothetical protein
VSDKLNPPRTVFFLLLMLSVTVYVGTSLTLIPLKTEPIFLERDEQEYYELAGNLLKGEYEFNSRRTLGHVLVLALFRILTFDNFLGTQLLATLTFALTAPLLYLLVRRMTDRPTLAAIAAIWAIFWPPFLYYGSSLYSETTTLPLFLSFLILLPRGSIFGDRPTRKWTPWLFCGSLLALCMLFRPMYLLFSPFALSIVFLEEKRWRQALRHASWLALGCCLIVLPWSIYMTANVGVPILISANGGETIAGGLNPKLLEQGDREMVTPQGRVSWIGPGKWLTASETGYLSREELKLSQAEQDRLLRHRTLRWVVSNPGPAIHLEVAKLLYMWGLYPWRLDRQTLFGNFPVILVLCLSLAALLRFRPYLRHLSRFWLLPIFVSGVALLSWGSWRFRQPGDLGLLTLSSLFLLSLRPASAQLLRKIDRD